MRILARIAAFTTITTFASVGTGTMAIGQVQAQLQQRPPQGQVQGQVPVPPQSRGPAAASPAAAPSAPVAAPFELSPAEQTDMDRFLAAWEKQSSGTQRLEAKFRRWHYDPLAAPAGVHATWAEGEIKYGAPDMGLFRVKQLRFYNGIVDDKATYKAGDNQFGEHWVCNGKELLEFDHAAKECRIQLLPEEMQGKDILESPLPFVFNLKAQNIKERYWVRRLPAPDGAYLIEAFPKRQADRAQYRFVRIVVDGKSFLPKALILYSPNYDPTTTPAYDHYEFFDVERNTLLQSLAAWRAGFINERPPSDWKVIRDTYRPGSSESPQMAQPGVADKTLR